MTGFQKFLHGVNNTPLGAIPTFRHEDRPHVERYVAGGTPFIGTEPFTLKAGEVLMKRSAEVGLRIDGVVTNSGIDAKKVLNQPLKNMKRNYSFFSVAHNIKTIFFPRKRSVTDQEELRRVLGRKLQEERTSFGRE